MIAIKRATKIPNTLTSTDSVSALAKLRLIASSGSRPAQADFRKLWGEKDVRKSLWSMQHMKCCYCERERDEARESDIEHFRPKSGVTGELSHLGYWWLAYDWKNLFFACRTCNQEHKKNLFPLQVGGVRAQGEGDALNNELALLIDPAAEDPEQYIGFDWQHTDGASVFPYGLDKQGRGNETIRIAGLDREVLNSDRADILLTLRALAQKMHAALHFGKALLRNEAIREIKEATAAKKRYAGFRRAFFRGEGLGKYIARN